MKKIFLTMLMVMIPLIARAGYEVTSAGNNIGLGTVNPQQVLDIEGGNELINNGWNIGVGTASPSQALSVNGNASFNGGISTAAWTDPINDWHAAGINTTTNSTGTNNSAQNTLTVASATGWSVGMGIAVQNAGTGGNTELISYITNINNNTFTLNDNLISTITTGQIVNHDDTRALNFAIHSGKNVSLSTGTYNITNALTILGPVIIKGVGAIDNTQNILPIGNTYTLISDRSTTHHVIDASTIVNVVNYLKLRDFSIQPPAGITKTSGYAIIIGSASYGQSIHHCEIDNITSFNEKGGISINGHVLELSIRHVDFRVTGSGGIAFNYANASTAGDIMTDSSNFNCLTTTSCYPLEITASDTNEFVHDDFNGGTNAVYINDVGGTTNVEHINFVGCSIENGDGTDPLVLITATTLGDVQTINFTGGEIGVNAGSADGVRITGAVRNISFVGNLFQTLGGYGVNLATTGSGFSFTGNVCESIVTAGFRTSSSTIPSGVSIVGNENCTVLNQGNLTTITDIENSNIGIGTSAPPSNLYVNGTSDLIGNVGIGTTVNNTGVLQIDKATNSSGVGDALGLCSSGSGYCVGYCTSGTYPTCAGCTCLAS